MRVVFLWAWMITIGIGMFQMGYWNVMFSSFLDILQPQLGKYGRDIIHDDNDFNAIMTTAVPAGAAVGAFTGGFLAAMGRRRAIFLVNAILCLGTGISMIFHFFSILAGRLIVGYSVGALTVLTPMFISETSPVKLLGPLGTLNQVMATIGIMVGYFLGFLAPLSLKSDDSENFAIYSTNSWRYVFMVPAIVAIFQWILLLFIFKYDTPKYYRQVGNEELALKSEQLIDPDLDGKARSLQPVQESTHKVKISQHCSPKYRWALMVGCLLAFFQQLTGINVVILYSNKVFTSGSNEENHNDLIRARTGTVIVGVVNWAATMVAIPLLFKIGRKALMLVGHTGMSLALIALGVLAIFEIDIAIIAFTMVFIAFFEIGVGSVVFLYLAEIMTEFGISMALAVVWSLTILVSLVTPRMIEQLHQDGLYFMFAGINVIGWFFILFCIKETKGKSKIELKGLYSKQNNNFEDVEVNISDEVTA